MLFRLPCSTHVIMWFLKAAAWSSSCTVTSPFGLACAARCIQTYETYCHFLITSSSALQDPPPIFFLLIRLEIWAECSGFTAQFVFPKVRYVFPLATCLHREFLPGKENNKIKLNGILRLVFLVHTFQLEITCWRCAGSLWTHISSLPIHCFTVCVLKKLVIKRQKILQMSIRHSTEVLNRIAPEQIPSTISIETRIYHTCRWRLHKMPLRQSSYSSRV